MAGVTIRPRWRGRRQVPGGGWAVSDPAREGAGLPVGGAFGVGVVAVGGMGSSGAGPGPSRRAWWRGGVIVVSVVVQGTTEAERVVVLGVLVWFVSPRVIEVIEVVGAWWSRWAGGARA